MDYNIFIDTMVMSLEQNSFEELKNILVNEEYLCFSFIKPEEISKEVLSDKLCDYFEKVEIKTGKKFDKHLQIYYKKLDELVSRFIPKSPQQKRNDDLLVSKTRATKYYEKAFGMINKKQEFTDFQILDYTRIMMCLEMAIIKKGIGMIENLEYSADCIEPIEILQAFRNKLGKIDKYSSNACSLVIAGVLLYKIIDNKIRREYYHG